MNIQQQTTSEVYNTETVVAHNEDLDPKPSQDISDVLEAVDFSSRSSSDSDKYTREWLKAKLICSYILSDGECPDPCIRALSIAPNHK